jgi:hypothetical protein
VFQACHVDGDNDDHEHRAKGHRDGDKCTRTETSKGCSSTNTVSNSATIASTEKPAPFEQHRRDVGGHDAAADSGPLESR